ncbi:MAG: tyrosine-type recombinase/integrase [Verrucomicrobiota bacterium]
MADRLARHDGSTLNLRGDDLLEYLRAKECLYQEGVRLDVAASEFSQAMAVLKGKGTLLEAVRHFSSSCAGEITPMGTQALVDDLIKAREANHASKRHLQDLKSRLNRFATAFQCDVHTIRAPQVQDFLLELKLSARSMNNYRMSISNLFTHAKLRGHAASDFDPLANIPWSKEADGEVEIYSPDELKLILEHARHAMIPYLALAAFAGLRQAEVAQLDWNEVKDDHIVVMGGISKTKTKRHVPILANLSEWLRPFRQSSGRVVPYDNVTNQLGKLAGDAKIKWKHNGLRHLFGSHRLAAEKDPATVSYEMGNSVSMVFKHYRKVVTEIQATRWFALYPDADLRPVFRLPIVSGQESGACRQAMAVNKQISAEPASQSPPARSRRQNSVSVPVPRRTNEIARFSRF